MFYEFMRSHKSCITNIKLFQLRVEIKLLALLAEDVLRITLDIQFKSTLLVGKAYYIQQSNLIIYNHLFVLRVLDDTNVYFSKICDSPNV